MSAPHETTATITVLDEANLYNINGPIVIGYSRTSITGQPLFSYQDATLDLNFTGEEITTTPTPIGELVTVTLENIVDAFVRTFTVLIPRITLQMGEEIEFDTLGVDATDRSGAFVPAPGPAGVLQTYQAHQLHGVARHVVS